MCCSVGFLESLGNLRSFFPHAALDLTAFPEDHLESLAGSFGLLAPDDHGTVNKAEEENERVVMQLATAEYKYLMQNNDAWNQIPSCYF